MVLELTESQLDVLVIGAGQQGLALGKLLKEKGLSFLILEKEEEVGARWKSHYDSLELFTPRRYSALPGLSLVGDPDGYASKDEFGEYLRDYARHFSLPIMSGVRVERLMRTEDGFFRAETTKGDLTARQVVVATGYAKPVVLAEGDSILHSSSYKNPSQIPNGSVLVVGNGNSAVQIALELAQTHHVDIAMHEMPRMIAPKTLGKSFYWWSDVFGIGKIPTDSLLGRFFARSKDFVVGHGLKHALSEGKLERKPGFASLQGKEVVFDDRTRKEYGTIIFATGFKADYSWLQVEGALTAEGTPIHKRGVSPVPGLYFSGLRNQITNVSSNIVGAIINAKHLVRKLI